ncbi:ATP dependent DNA ligase [Shewanella halifaxensis HAW-EB4]|uniref:ATP dependent DNA ligase n=2 Tax=Shewanella halifaxensis TaxID=271098 RepID=B0TQR2_SHEHH|nr:ATP dependent DNA ligase [Shewanella halifaxensis HAW-EB4]
MAMFTIRLPSLIASLIVACLFITNYSFATSAEIPPNNTDKPSIQLASTTTQPMVNISGYLVSEKLDGVRGYWDGKAMYSRSGRLINLPAWFIEGFPEFPLDGELWIERGTFEQVSATVRKTKASDAEWAKVRFWVFDLPDDPNIFELRYYRATKVLQGVSPFLAVIRQYTLSSNQALDSQLQGIIADNGEGLMLHKKTALYKAGRSKDIVKLKPFYDAEAVVVAHTSGKGKFSGMLGALVVKNEQGKVFNLGSGFTQEQRLDPPKIGSQVTYKYYGLTQKGTPRFASFLRVRQSQ